MNKNQFATPNCVDHAILDGQGNLLGHVRIKPNAVLWRRRSARKWRGLTLEQLSRLAEEHGRLQNW